MSRQGNDLEPEIYSEHNAQGFPNRETFESIISDSHYSLYLDNFNVGNFSPLGINDISKNKEDHLNKLPISFYQDREKIIHHYFSINEHEFSIPPCFDILDKIKGNSREYCEVVYDNYSDIKDVDFCSSQENPHD